NLRTGRSTLASRGDGSDADDYLLDNRGEIAARTEADRVTNEWKLFGYVNGSPRLLRQGRNETGSSPSLHGLLADGRLVTRYRDNGESHYQAIDMASGAGEEIMPQRSAAQSIVDPLTRRVIGYSWQDDFERFQYFVPELTNAQTMLNEMFAD